MGKATVLILGGGFAGRTVAQTLARAAGRDLSVCLIDSRRDSEFRPLYPDIISGRIRRRGISQGLRSFCGDLRIDHLRARVQAIDLAGRLVETSAGPRQADFLVVCLGCRTNYHGNEEIRRRAPGVGSIGEALSIRRQAKRHMQTWHDRREQFHLAVVGGGYTGIETASQLAYLLRRQTHLSWERLRRIAVVIVLQKAHRVLEMIPRSVADWAVRHIQAYDVQVRTNVTLAGFDGDSGVQLTDGSRLDNCMVVWAAGVTPVDACTALETPKVAHGRLAVDAYLRLPGHDRVFVAGDAAGAIPPGGNEPLRMGVQMSRVGGIVAARNVLAAIQGGPLEVFDPFDPGYVIPLAHSLGVGEVFGREYHGRLPYDLHYFMSMVRSFTWRNRLAVARDLLNLPPRRRRGPAPDWA